MMRKMCHLEHQMSDELQDIILLIKQLYHLNTKVYKYVKYILTLKFTITLTLSLALDIRSLLFRH